MRHPYRAVMSAAVQTSLSYRLSYFLTIVSQFIAYIVFYYIWKVILSGSSQINGYTWEKMRYYLLVVFFMNSIMTWYTERNLSLRILSGDVIFDILRPYNYQLKSLFETLGSMIAEAVLVIGFILVSFIWNRGAAIEPVYAVLFVPSVILGFMVKFMIIQITSLCTFWTSNSMGLVWLRTAVTDFCSGALIPLAFMPGPVRAVLSVLPFRSIVADPASILLDTPAAGEIAFIFARQVCWLAVLGVCAGALWRAGLKKISVMGG